MLDALIDERHVDPDEVARAIDVLRTLTEQPTTT